MSYDYYQISEITQETHYTLISAAGRTYYQLEISYTPTHCCQHLFRVDLLS